MLVNIKRGVLPPPGCETSQPAVAETSAVSSSSRARLKFCLRPLQLTRVPSPLSFCPRCWFVGHSKTAAMGVGAKKPVNIFKLKDLGEPEGALNWRLWFAVFSFGLLGAARGVDEGLISGAFNSDNFKESIHYASYDTVDQANIKANVSAMVQIGSVAGALM